MEGCSKMGEDCPQLLDLIPKDREWLLKRDKQRSHGSSTEEINNLELRLGPPGEENSREREESNLSLGYFSNMTHLSSGAKRGFTGEKSWVMNLNENPQQRNGSYLQMQSNPEILPVMGKESSQPCSTRMVELLQGGAEKKKGFSAASANTAVLPNSSQKRCSSTPQLFSFFPLLCFVLDRGYSLSVKFISRRCGGPWSLHFYVYLSVFAIFIYSWIYMHLCESITSF